MKLTFLGACNDIGKSSFLVQFNEVSLVLDTGIKLHDHNEAPDFHQHKFDAALVTHAHLDHSGALPCLYKHGNPPSFCTYPTAPIVELLLADSEKIARQENKVLPFTRQQSKKAVKKLACMAFEQEYEFFDGTRFWFKDAGHIPGSAMAVVEFKGKRLLYTGDFNKSQTRLHDPAQALEADYLVIESTYSNRDHPPRKQIEKEFCGAVEKALAEGCTVLVPCFAVGRTQEILQVLHDNRVRSKIFLDGMGKKVCDIVYDFPSYLRDYDAFIRAVHKTEFIESRQQRKRVTERPCVVVSTAGMLDGGPALNYIQALTKRGKAAIFLTGYQVEGTNGRMLVEQGKIKDRGRIKEILLPVKQFDFSAHAGKRELFEFVKKVNPEKVFCMHGDDCNGFAAELKEKGFDAVAPKQGQSFKVS